MPKQGKRINYALAATLFATGQSLEAICPQVGAKNVNTLRVGLHRKGVTKAALQHPTPDSPMVKSLTLTVAKEAGEKLKGMLGGEIERTTAKLADIEPRKNLKDLRQRAEVIEPLVRSAAKVYGWSDADKPTISLNFITETRLDELPALDVESVQTPQPVEIPEKTS